MGELRIMGNGNAERVGIGLGVLATLLWSSAFISARYLMGSVPPRLDPMSLVFYRFLIGSILVFAMAKVRGDSLKLRSASEIRQVIAVSFFLYFLMSYLNFYGQRTASATTAALFLESGPALIVIIWKLLRGKSTSRAEIGAVIAGLIGCMMVLNIISADGIHYTTGSWLGELSLLGAAISWVIGSVYGQELMRSERRLALTGWCQVFAGAMVLPAALCNVSGIIIPTGWDAWGAIVLIGIFPTGLAFVAWSAAMPRLALWKLSMLQNLTPIFTLFGAWLLLGERPTGFNFAGIVLVLAGLSAAILATRRKAD